MFSRPVSFAVAGIAGVATLTVASAPSPLYPVYQRLWGFSSFTLTVIFAVYVAALLISLLTVGSLSDRIGRRPVASASLVLLAVGMLLFVVADGTGGLIAARVVQGLAVGAATGTMTAMILDSGPTPKAGSILSSAVPSLGIAIGAILSGALVEYAPFPRQLVFVILGALYLVVAVLVWFIPERTRTSSPSQQSIARSLLPSAGLPPAVRPIFFTLLPSIGASWALGGLYLSLGSSIIGGVLGVRSHFVIGIVLGAFFVAGALGTVLSASLPAHLEERFGHAALVVGVALTVAAMLLDTVPLYVVGSVIAGFGFGSAFRYVVTVLGGASPSHARGQVFATMYIASYLAFSVPALVAGLAISHVGLKPTAVAYGAFDVALVVVAVISAGARSRSRRPVLARA